MSFLTKTKRKVANVLLTTLLTVTTVLSPVTPLVPRVLASQGTSGTVNVGAPEGGTPVFYKNGNGSLSGNIKVNGKFVNTNAGEEIPVYCIEHGKKLDTVNTVTKSTLTEGTTIRSSVSGQFTDITLTQAQINRLGAIYALGYNGYNGWGELDGNIYKQDVSPDQNDNFAKYIATQCLIWETVEGVTYYAAAGSAIQNNIDILRARIEYYDYLCLAGAYYNKPTQVNEVPMYKTAADALAHVWTNSSTSKNPPYEFNFTYPPYCNPTNNIQMYSPTGSTIENKTANGFSTPDKEATFVIQGYPQFPVKDFGGGYIYGPGVVELWTPTEGDRQLTISANINIWSGYMAFASPKPTTEKAYVNFAIGKRTEDGRYATGAEFTIYNDAACKNVVATSVDNKDGFYVFDEVFLGETTDLLDVTYYYKETKAPTKAINADGSTSDIIVQDSGMDKNVYSVRFQYDVDTVANNYPFTYTFNVAGKTSSATVYNWKDNWDKDENRLFLKSAQPYGTSLDWMNTTSVRLNLQLNIEKKCEDNSTRARGAEFSMYGEASCKTAIGGFTAKDDVFTSPYLTVGTYPKTQTTPVTGSYFFKETKAATEYYKDGKWVANSFALDSSVYKLSYSYVPSTNALTYSIVKVDASGNKIADVKASTTINNYINNAGNIATIPSLSLSNERRGSITVQKVNPSKTALSGAEFKVYSDAACTKEVKTFTETATKGTYQVTDLKIGTYYVKETKAPTNYQLDPKVYTVNITKDNLTGKVDNTSNPIIGKFATTGTFVNIGLGDVTVKKVSQTGATLTGATFTVYSDADCKTSVGTLTDNGSGTYTRGGLYLNSDLTAKTYYLKETKAPTGYMLDPNVYPFTISADKLSVTVDNTSFTAIKNYTQTGKFVDVSYGSIKVIKVDADDNTKPVSGATFTVYEDKACTKIVGDMTETTAGTYEIKNCPLNSDFTAKTYYVKETKAPADYILDNGVYEIKVTVDVLNPTADNTTNVTLGAKAKEGKFVELKKGTVTVTKTDAITKATVTGAEFTVYSDADCKTVVGTLTDNKDGTYTRGGLDLGTNMADKTYYLKETKAAPGYNKDPNVYSFTITASKKDATVDNVDFATIKDYVVAGNFVEIPLGSVTVEKVGVDNEPISGAVFNVYDDAACTKYVGKLTETATKGTYSYNELYLSNDLSERTYYVKEISVDGYNVDPNAYSFEISVNSLNAKVDNFNFEGIKDYATEGKFVEIPLGSVTIEKVGIEGETITGATFNLYNDEACTDLVAPFTEVTEGTYVVENLFLNDDLSDRTYYVKEISVGDEYHVDPFVYPVTLKYNDRDKTVDNTSNELIAKYAEEGKFVELRTGSVTIKKVGIEGETISGAVFAIYDDKALTNELGKFEETEEGIYVFDGLRINNDLTAKTYYVKELSVSEKYHVDPEVYKAVISADDLDITLDNALNETIAKYKKEGYFVEIPLGSITIKKAGIDGEIVKGATYKLYADYTCETEIGTFKETEDGVYVYEGLRINDDLSGKAYFVKETAVPDGYHIDPNTYICTLSVDNLFAVVDNTSNSAISQYASNGMFIEVPFGSVTVEKYHKATDKLMSGCEFVVFNDKECTDKVGELKETTKGVYVLEGLKLNDDLSDRTYYLVETKTADGCEIDPTVYDFKISVAKLNAKVGNSGEKFLNDNPIPGTQLTSEVGTSVAPVGEDKKFVDTIFYDALIAGKEYEAVGTAYSMDIDGNPILDEEGNIVPLLDKDGKQITSSAKFTPEGKEGTLVSGTVDVEFTIDTSLLGGTSFYIYEDVYRDGKLVGFHHEVKDQTGFIPEIHTTLISSESNSQLIPNTTDKAELTDTVLYKNLPNGKYVMEGTLMDFESGKVLTVDGKTFTMKGEPFEINNEVNKGVSGTSDVKFVIPASVLKDTTLVAFETLYAITVDENGNEVLVPITSHNDITAVTQTGYIPDVGTQFYDKGLGIDSDITTYSKNATLEDKVKLTNVIDGDYELTSKIMIKETGEPLLDKDGNVQYATAKFTITKDECKDGPITAEKFVTFTGIDTTVLEGKTLVCFESLERNGILIAVEADLNNPDQTIRVPKAKTTLVDETTQTHTMVVARDITLVDTVEYFGLEVGKEYDVTGHLYDVDTGKAILDENGKEITATSTFKTTATDGIADVTFKFKYDSVVNVTRVVAFEDIYDKETGLKVATHADLNDEAQQVKKASIKTLATVNGQKTFFPEENIVLNELCSYEGLCPDREYTLFAEAYIINADNTVMKFMVDGNAVTSTADFVASESGAGETDCIKFNFKGSDLPIGSKIVIYETVTDKKTGAVVATEYDPTCEDQTVTVVKKPVTVKTGEEINVAKCALEAAILTAIIVCAYCLIKNNVKIKREDKQN